MDKKCKHCGKYFEGGPKKRYCSIKCRSATARDRALKKREFVCKQCGKSFVVFTTQRHQKHFCSTKCKNEYGNMRAIKTVCKKAGDVTSLEDLIISDRFKKYLLTEIMVFDEEEFIELFEIGKRVKFSNNRVDETYYGEAVALNA